MKHGKGTMMVSLHEEENPKAKKKTQAYGFGKVRFFSRFLMCPTTGISYDEPAPNLFSFNSPYGACPQCNGLGEVSEIDCEQCGFSRRVGEA